MRKERRWSDGDLEVRAVTPEEMIEELEAMVRKMQKNKYAFQVGIKEVRFTFDRERAETLAVSPEMTMIDRAEMYLREGCLVPVEFTEDDGTVHRVLEWDPTVVGRSGFMGCVAHSIVTTDRGVFEVGRYPAMNIADFSKRWQWFIHRRIEGDEGR